MNLEKLYAKRIKWVDANKENNFEDGIKRLLTDLYPDNAHFIYELLQNAEDPGATVVRFTLSESLVEFEHNGKRLFSLQDVDSITSIGNSTKRDDSTSIGKFGVGFKAVFAYTNTPEVHSGQFHFRIRDLVVPETNGVPKPKMGECETHFVFPFDNERKPRKQAVAEVERGLRSLGDNTLLFLAHIRKIEYLLPDGSLGSIERVEEGGGRIEIRSTKPDGTSSTSHWLRFDKVVSAQDDDGEAKECRIAIAYRLAEDQAKGRKLSWKVVPLDRGEVSIFFPAEKETSNLHFHIHAPFASTVARDSVRDCVANDQLFKHIADLVVETLEPIRDQGLLTVGFLATLPNPTDNLAGTAPRYEPIRKALIAAFKEGDFTPTKLGGHAPSSALYRGPARIADVVSDDDLFLLTGFASPLWAANAPQANQREDRFIESLDIDAWGWDELTDPLYHPSPEEKFRIENWLASKDDTWLMKFYALLGEAIETHGKLVFAPDIAIVRASNGEGDQYMIPKEVFLPPEIDEQPPTGVLFVKPSVYAEGRSESQKRLARSFLEGIGVRPFNPKTEIELRLQKYDNPTTVTSDHYDDISAFVSYWKSNPTHAAMFKGKKILLGQGKEQSRIWCNETRLCMDRPYLETNLSGFESAHGKRPVCTEYFERLGTKQHKDFVDFMRAVGVSTELNVSKVLPWPGNDSWPKMYAGLGRTRDTDTRIADDFIIENIQIYLSAGSVVASQLIWDALIKAEKRCAKARYRPNQEYTVREAESQLVYHLKKHSWIPGNDGEFHTPASITSADLPTSFPFDDRNGLLTAIGFGEEAKRRSEECGARDENAKDIGFDSAHEADLFLAMKRAGFTEDDAQRFINSRQRTELPIEAVPNPERRRLKIQANADGAPTRESVLLERAIQTGTSEVAAQARAYLRAKYTNSHGQLVCQCCHREMPFKLPAGEYYFEAVQCIPDKDQRHFQNRIALCPVCSAMYRVVRETGDEEVRSMLIQHEAEDGAPSVEIPIRLAGQHFKLYFVGAHWFDLKTVL